MRVRRIEALDFATPIKCSERIPMALLQERGHIHFYDQVGKIDEFHCCAKFDKGPSWACPCNHTRAMKD